jgi:hypothetical protein
MLVSPFPVFVHPSPVEAELAGMPNSQYHHHGSFLLAVLPVVKGPIVEPVLITVFAKFVTLSGQQHRWSC